MALASVVSALAIFAAACSDSKKSESEETTTTAAATTESSAPETTTGLGTEAPTTTTAEKPTLGGKIVVAGEAEAGTPWTPYATNCDSYCDMRIQNVYDKLAALDTDLKVHPFLAESITPNADFTQWTIKMRSGITFTDGAPLNADAVIYNLQASFGSPLIAAAVKDLARVPTGKEAADQLPPVKIEKVDDMTLTIYTGLNGDPTKPLPWPGFDYYRTGQGAFIASPAYLTAALATEDHTGAGILPVGTGPFIMESFTSGDRMVLKKNPNYWMKDEDGVAYPYLDEIEFRVIPDSTTREQALESGDVDLISTSNANTVASLRSKADKFPMIEQTKGVETFYILLHLTKPVLQSRDLRCAMLQAIDKQALIDLTGGGILTPANGPFSPGQEGHLEDNGSLPYDPAAAKAGVEAYKAANGGAAPKIIYSTVPDADSLTTAQYLQQVWGEAGIEVEIKQIEQSTLIINALFGSPDFDAFGWRNHGGLFVDNQYFWWHKSAALPDGQLALNFGRLTDPVIDGLLEQQRSELDPAKRQAIAEDINRQFAKECWILPTSWTIWGIAQNGTIGGLATLKMPDGSGATVRDGVYFPGQVWLTQAYKRA